MSIIPKSGGCHDPRTFQTTISFLENAVLKDHERMRPSPSQDQRDSQPFKELM
jgi:hypothetical protein